MCGHCWQTTRRRQVQHKSRRFTRQRWRSTHRAEPAGAGAHVERVRIPRHRPGVLAAGAKALGAVQFRLRHRAGAPAPPAEARRGGARSGFGSRRKPDLRLLLVEHGGERAAAGRDDGQRRLDRSAPPLLAVFRVGVVSAQVRLDWCRRCCDRRRAAAAPERAPAGVGAGSGLHLAHNRPLHWAPAGAERRRRREHRLGHGARLLLRRRALEERLGPAQLPLDILDYPRVLSAVVVVIDRGDRAGYFVLIIGHRRLRALRHLLLLLRRPLLLPAADRGEDWNPLGRVRGRRDPVRAVASHRHERRSQRGVLRRRRRVGRRLSQSARRERRH